MLTTAQLSFVCYRDHWIPHTRIAISASHESACPVDSLRGLSSSFPYSASPWPGVLSPSIPRNRRELPPVALVASLPVAAISTNILVVNNVRDLETDAEAGKRTLAVRIGYRWSRVQYVALLALAYLVPVGLWLTTPASAAVLLPLLTIPLAVAVSRTICTRTGGEALNPALERTGKLLAAHALCFAVGLALGL